MERRLGAFCSLRQVTTLPSYHPYMRLGALCSLWQVNKLTLALALTLTLTLTLALTLTLILTVALTLTLPRFKQRASRFVTVQVSAKPPPSG